MSCQYNAVGINFIKPPENSQKAGFFITLLVYVCVVLRQTYRFFVVVVLKQLFKKLLRIIFLPEIVCPPMCACVYMLMPTCVYAGVRAHPSVCVCTFLGSARQLTDTEKTAVVAEETDIDAEEANQITAGEESNLNRGVTDLDATSKPPDINHLDNKVNDFLSLSVF